EQAGVVAVADGEPGAAGDLVAQPVDAGAEQLVLADGEVALHRSGVAAGVEAAGEGPRAGGAVGERVVRIGVGAADADVDVGIRVRAPAQAAAEDLLAGVGLVAAEDAAIVLVEGVGDQHMALQLDGFADLAAAAHAHRRVAVAVAVGFVDEAARAPAFGGAAAGVDAVGALPGALGLEPAVFAATADAGAGLAQAVAAHAQAEVGAQAFASGGAA